MILIRKIIYLLNLLNQKPYSDYFFKKLNNFEWFQPLKDNGYFYPEQIRYDKQDNAIFWNVLDYLERMSGQVINNIRYGKEIIEIISSVWLNTATMTVAVLSILELSGLIMGTLSMKQLAPPFSSRK